jgi:hypothetical protein
MYVASDDNIVMQNASDISMQIIALQKKKFPVLCATNIGPNMVLMSTHWNLTELFLLPLSKSRSKHGQGWQPNIVRS